jgi:hypothetical protein
MIGVQLLSGDAVSVIGAVTPRILEKHGELTTSYIINHSLEETSTRSLVAHGA